MDRLAFTSLNAINERRLARQVLTNEVANITTTGFKRSYEVAYEAIKTEGSGYDTRFSPQIAAKDFIQLDSGPLIVTGKPTDIALQQKTVMGVRGRDGATAFTRRGDLRLNEQGVLENGQGFAVLGEGGTPISIPAGFGFNITDRGQVYAKDPAQPAPQVEVLVGQILLRDASQMQLVRRTDTLFDPFVNGQPKPGDFPTGPNSPKLTQGALEGSSVNPITALVGLIDAERSFESGIRFIKQAKEIDESGSQLLKA